MGFIYSIGVCVCVLCDGISSTFLTICVENAESNQIELWKIYPSRCNMVKVFLFWTYLSCVTSTLCMKIYVEYMIIWRSTWKITKHTHSQHRLLRYIRRYAAFLLLIAVYFTGWFCFFPVTIIWHISSYFAYDSIILFFTQIYLWWNSIKT